MQRALEGNSWTFAKTMPHCPHWYTLRKNWSGDMQFDTAVELIRQHGKPALYYRKVHIYLTLGEWKYWTMGAPIDETILINRERVPA